MKAGDLVRLTEGGAELVRRLDGGGEPEDTLPVGTVGKVTSVLSQGLVDVLFHVDGVFWLGSALMGGSDVERVDPITAIGSLDAPSV